MSHRRAKKIRRLSVNKEDLKETGARSRGEFLRGTTEYSVVTPTRGKPSVLILEPDSPRSWIQDAKKVVL